VGETFSLDVNYDGDDINFTDIHFDGTRVDDYRLCEDEEPSDIYQVEDDGDLALHYIFHIHNDTMDGWIKIDI
jgi:hypothetical protein